MSDSEATEPPAPNLPPPLNDHPPQDSQQSSPGIGPFGIPLQLQALAAASLLLQNPTHPLLSGHQGSPNNFPSQISPNATINLSQISQPISQSMPTPRASQNGSQLKGAKRKQVNKNNSPKHQRQRKTPILWDGDDNGRGQSSMALLVELMSDFENYNLWRSKNSSKKSVSEKVHAYLVEKGILHRDPKGVMNQMTGLEKSFREAHDWRHQTGAGVMDDAEAEKALHEWSDDDPAWLECKKKAEAPILQRCRYYFELEPVMADRPSGTRLAAKHSQTRARPPVPESCESPASSAPGSPAVQVDESDPRALLEVTPMDSDDEHSVNSLEHRYKERYGKQDLDHEDVQEDILNHDMTQESPVMRSTQTIDDLRRPPSSQPRRVPSTNLTPGAGQARQKAFAQTSLEGPSLNIPRGGRAVGAREKVERFLAKKKEALPSPSMTPFETQLLELHTKQEDQLGAAARELVNAMNPQGSSKHDLLSVMQRQEEAALEFQQRQMEHKINLRRLENNLERGMDEEVELAQLQIQAQRSRLADEEIAREGKRAKIELKRKCAELEMTSERAKMIGMLMKDCGLSVEDATAAAIAAANMAK